MKKKLATEYGTESEGSGSGSKKSLSDDNSRKFRGRLNETETSMGKDGLTPTSKLLESPADKRE